MTDTAIECGCSKSCYKRVATWTKGGKDKDGTPLSRNMLSRGVCKNGLLRFFDDHNLLLPPPNKHDHVVKPALVQEILRISGSPQHDPCWEQKRAKRVTTRSPAVSAPAAVNSFSLKEWVRVSNDDKKRETKQSEPDEFDHNDNTDDDDTVDPEPLDEQAYVDAGIELRKGTPLHFSSEPNNCNKTEFLGTLSSFAVYHRPTTLDWMVDYWGSTRDLYTEIDHVSCRSAEIDHIIEVQIMDALLKDVKGLRLTRRALTIIQLATNGAHNFTLTTRAVNQAKKAPITKWLKQRGSGRPLQLKHLILGNEQVVRDLGSKAVCHNILNAMRHSAAIIMHILRTTRGANEYVRAYTTAFGALCTEMGLN